MYQLTLMGEEKTPQKKYTTVCREMVAEYGIYGTDLSHVIGIIIGGRVTKETCVKLASLGIKELASLTAEELMAYPGVGIAGATRLIMAFDLARRLVKSKHKEKEIIKKPRDVYMLLKDMELLDKEVFKAIFLNIKNHILSIETISIGNLNSTIVHPREVFKPAIKKSAASIIVVHNHPSGNSRPSLEDVAITKKLAEAGELIGIKVLDHIVIGQGNYTSLKEEKYF